MGKLRYYTGPVLNNCSLGRVCKGKLGVSYRVSGDKANEFVDHIADPDSDKYLPNSVIELLNKIQFEKRLTISAENYVLLKINSKCNGENLTVNNEKIQLVNVAKYLGDSFNSKGSYADLCKD